MKKVILASVVLGATVVSGVVQAAEATVCVSGGTPAAVATSATGFVKVTFTPKCSANTYASVDDNGTYLRVAAASSKGKFPFYGSTVSGGVIASTTSCAATGCAASDVATAITLGATG